MAVRWGILCAYDLNRIIGSHRISLSSWPHAPIESQTLSGLEMGEHDSRIRPRPRTLMELRREANWLGLD